MVKRAGQDRFHNLYCNTNAITIINILRFYVYVVERARANTNTKINFLCQRCPEFTNYETEKKIEMLCTPVLKPSPTFLEGGVISMVRISIVHNQRRRIPFLSLNIFQNKLTNDGTHFRLPVSINSHR